LPIEAQSIRTPPGVEVQQVSHPKQKQRRVFDRRPFAREQNAAVHELLQRRDAKPRARRPMRDVDVPQPADAVLHVRLEQVHGPSVALAAVSHAYGEPLQELGDVADPEEPLERTIEHLVAERPVARHDAPIEQRRRRRQIRLRHLDHLVRRDELVTDVESGVPERIEQRFGDLPRALDAGVRQHPHVEIAVERRLLAAVAADGREPERHLQALGDQRRLEHLEERRQKAVDDLAVTERGG
jgi:hypothetical protein